MAKEELLGELPLQAKAPVDSNGTETQYNRFSLSPDRRRFPAIGKTDKKKWSQQLRVVRIAISHAGDVDPLVVEADISALLAG